MPMEGTGAVNVLIPKRWAPNLSFTIIVIFHLCDGAPSQYTKYSL